jgi:hypothetical protein
MQGVRSFDELIAAIGLCYRSGESGQVAFYRRDGEGRGTLRL